MSVPAPVAFAVACLGLAIFSAMDAVMKQQSLLIGAYSAMVWRTVFGMGFSGATFFALRQRRPGREAMILHAKRGTAAGLSVVLFFWGLTHVPLAQGVALTFTAPLIALFLAVVLLGERVPPRAVGASVLAFAGVLVILAGQARAEMGPEAFRGALAILLASFIYAYNMVLLRAQAKAAGPVEIAFFTNIVMALLYLPAAPLLLVIPEAAEWPWLAFAALLAFLSILLLSWAYARAEANYLAPAEYSAFVWASILGWLVFGERLQLLTLAGAAMIVTGCIIAARRAAAPAAQAEAQL